MANPVSGSINPMDQLEDAFIDMFKVVCKEDEDAMDENQTDMYQALDKFLDTARKIETFFIQKRFIYSALKPEFILKEEISNLNHELSRKEELIKNHHKRITEWQNLLSDVNPNWAKMQQGVPPSGIGALSVGMGGAGGVGNQLAPMQGLQGPPMRMPPGMPTNQAMLASMSPLQQQQLQQMQQQKASISSMGAGPSGGLSGPPQGGPVLSPQQAMFMHQQSLGPRSPYPGGQPGPSVISGPLAYLEKTTSNIGVSDGRR